MNEKKASKKDKVVKTKSVLRTKSSPSPTFDDENSESLGNSDNKGLDKRRNKSDSNLEQRNDLDSNNTDTEDTSEVVRQD